MTTRNLLARLRAQEVASPADAVLFIPAAARTYNTVGSSLASIAGSRFPCWQHPDSADSQGNLILDEDELRARGWNTYAIDLIHGNPNAGTGNVVLSITTSVVASGGNFGSGDVTLTNGVAVAAGAQSIHTVYRVSSSLTVTAGALRHLRLLRAGGDAGDTLVGAWNWLGFRLTKVS